MIDNLGYLTRNSFEEWFLNPAADLNSPDYMLYLWILLAIFGITVFVITIFTFEKVKRVVYTNNYHNLRNEIIYNQTSLNN